jgi:cysteine desulfurase
MVFRKTLKLLKSEGGKRAYLDYAAQTPLGKAASKVLRRSLEEGVSALFGNPASSHAEGLKASIVLEDSRKALARLLGVLPDEVVFTGNATEANNLAILGVVRKAIQKKRAMGDEAPVHIITSTIEHSSIRLVCKNLEHEGVKVTYVAPTPQGVISRAAIEEALTEHTVLVSLSYVNSELGTITSVRDIARAIALHKKKLKEGAFSTYPYLHVDGSQAMTQLSLNPHDIGADLLTLDGGKCYGPKGVGALVVLRGRELSSIMQGGSHEGGLRPGTPAVNLVEAFVAAYGETIALSDKEEVRLQKLETSFMKGLKKLVPDVSVHGEGAKRLHGFCNVCIPKLDAEFAVIELDVRGVAVSSASACMSLGGDGTSYVIKALKGRESCAAHSLRISMGRYTTMSDLTHLLKALKEVLPQ